MDWSTILATIFQLLMSYLTSEQDDNDELQPWFRNQERLEVIHSYTFMTIENLTILNLSNKNLKEIKPYAFDQLKNVRVIDLNMNNLTSLPRDLFRNMRRLREIDLSGNNFHSDSFPNDLLRNLQNIESFTMMHNKQAIRTLPKGFFSDLVELNYLKLTDIGLFNVHEDLLWGSNAIEELYLDKNGLQYIPPNFFRDCEDLEKLILKSNEIDSLQDHIFSTLTNLEVLDLSYNRIKTISTNLLSGLSSLRTIKMEHNLLTTIDPEAFRSLRSLQVAHFSYNRLTLKSSKIKIVNKNRSYSPFWLCQDTLEELHFDHNSISEIFSDWIAAPRLRILNLAHNKISYLNMSNLQFLSNIIEVDMSRNEIRSVDLQDFEILTSRNRSKVTINVQDNPIRCDCKLNSLLEFIKGNIQPYVQNNDEVFSLKISNLKCHQSESLEGVEMGPLKSESLPCKMKELLKDNISCPQNCKCMRSSSDKSILIDCSFRGLTTASKLELDDSALGVIDAGFFNDKENLKILNISNSGLRTIEPYAFDKLKLVKVIDLHMNKLASLPRDLFSKTTKLIALDLSQNEFHYNSYPNNLLHNNVLLANFTMTQNKRYIPYLPERFLANLKSLKHIKLTGNGIHVLPDNLIWNSTNIETIYMDKNDLRRMPPDFFRDSKKLKKLILSSNSIDYLPGHIFSTLTNLEILDLSYNRIKTISTNLLNGLSSLRTIKMDHNLLTTIDPEAFRSLQSLQFAYFSNNKLTLILSEIIDVCKDTLEELHLDHNSITEIFSNWITAPRLRILNLAHNKISYLHISDLKLLSNTIEVDVSNNEIHTVDLQGIDMLTSKNLGKVTVNVQDNPIRCDCKLNSLLKFIKGNIQPDGQNNKNILSLKVDKLKCHQPDFLEGVEITSLKSKLLTCM